MTEIRAPKSKSTGIPGWHSEEEEKALMSLAASTTHRHKKGVIVELGGEYGRSASEFAKATEGFDYQIITVDKFPHNHPVVGDLLACYTRHLKEANLFHRVTAYRRDSADFATQIADASVHLLFVDAAHDYRGVKRDIEAWYNKVMPGGVMVFHDYANEHNGKKHHHSHYEVKQAVDEWHAQHPEWTRQAGPDSLVWFTRPVEKAATPAKSEPLTQPLISVTEACQMLKVSRSTFNRLFRDRLTITKKEGRKFYYTRADVEALMNNG